ncbi:hypothetical protein ACIJYF_01190 [Candidatus Pelagibacter bacterium nBUS_49]|uniref:hypothetical protein n=1 Tax=Candidatus Pelagibacter bacterium nBUS_49 TaxID=3374196 RepID=UPI003EBD82CB
MNFKNNSLLAIHLNEFNFDYLERGAKKYKCKSILKVLSLKKVSTFTKDNRQDYNLDPWVQSVSINTGKPSKKHKIYKLGQRIEKNISQIWDVLSKKKISCSVYGTMNSRLKINKYINYYLPDPWNFRDKTWPKSLMGLYFLPNYYAKNYLKFSYLKFFYYSINFFVTLVFNTKILDLLNDLVFSLKVILKKGIKNYVLFFLFDLIQLNIFNYNNHKKKSSFSIIFLNSIAHYQHNNWNEKKSEKYFFLYVDKMFSKILKLKKQYKSIIIFNGFTQKKIKPHYLIRPKNPKKFISNFISFKKIEQDMTNGGFIFFKNNQQFENGIQTLNNLYFKNKKVFEIKKYNKKLLYYKVNLKSLKIITNSEMKNDKNFEKYFLESLQINRKNKKKIDISNYFIKEVQFLKTTGIHVPEGIVLYENINSLNSLKVIENHTLFNHMRNYFITNENY